MKKYKEIDHKAYEQQKFEIGSYFKTLNIEDARMMLKIKLKMVPTIRSHFKSNKKYKAERFQCPDCNQLGILDTTDSMEHVLTSSCEANMDLREGKDFTKDEEVCKFFTELIKLRVDRHRC